MCVLVSFCTQEIDSSPPATITGTRSTITRCAAMAMACRPEEQKRLTVVPAVVTGNPARRAICRATFPPVVPSGRAQPMITSSTSPGSTPARSTAARTACAPMVGPWVMFKAPRQDLARPVRAVETMTASGMGTSRKLERKVVTDHEPQLNVLPSAAREARSGAGFQKPGSACGLAAKRFIARTTL